MNCRLVLTTILFLCLAVPQAGLAAADPCAADGEKYCPTFRGKDPRKYYCLQQVGAAVSHSCRRELSQVSGSLAEFLHDCEVDYHRLCKEIVPGEGRIVACLRKHSKEVAFECRKQLVGAP